MQLSINNVSMRFGARILFEDVNTTFISGRRYAITGPNGAGKSTLMKIMTGEVDAAILLDGLDIPEDFHDRKMSELQGGRKVRVLLAQALFGNPDALLLDEPTNNLDLDSVHWLQNHLRAYKGCLIVISHDRHFLNEICTHTADIDYETVITYTGSYDDMVLAKTQA